MLSCVMASNAFAGAVPSPPLRIKGSFVIAAICRDGIMIASDSRGTLKNDHGQRIAYYDVNQKIFPIGNSVIADTGYASIDDPRVSFLAALMADFADDARSRTAVEKLPSSYFQYVNTMLPRDGADSAKVQTLFFAGYEGRRPVLCIYKGETSRNTACSSSGYLASPNVQVSGLEKVSSLSFEEAAGVMRRAINDYAAAISPGAVGGPVVLRIITQSRSDWWGSHPEWPSWTSFSDLARDYKASRVKFHLLPGADKRALDVLVEQAAAWASLAQTP